MELDKSSTGRLKSVHEVDTAVAVLIQYGGLAGNAAMLRKKAEIAGQGNARFLVAPLEFGPEYRHDIITNLRRAGLGKKPAYGYRPVTKETATHARIMLEPFHLLRPWHKRFFSRIVKTHQIPSRTEEN